MQIVKKRHPCRLLTHKIKVNLTLDPLHPEILQAVSDSMERSRVVKALKKDFQVNIKPVIEQRKPTHKVAMAMETTRQSLAQYIEETKRYATMLNLLKFCLLGFMMAVIFVRFADFGQSSQDLDQDGKSYAQFNSMSSKDYNEHSILDMLISHGFGMRILSLADFIRS